MKKKVEITGLQKLPATIRKKRGITITEVCQQVGISRSTFNNWKRAFSDPGLLDTRYMLECNWKYLKFIKTISTLELDKKKFHWVYNNIVLRPIQMRGLTRNSHGIYRTAVLTECPLELLALIGVPL